MASKNPMNQKIINRFKELNNYDSAKLSKKREVSNSKPFTDFLKKSPKPSTSSAPKETNNFKTLTSVNKDIQEINDLIANIDDNNEIY